MSGETPIDIGAKGKNRALIFVAKISEAELALRLLRIGVGIKPSAGQTAEVAIAEAEAGWPPQFGDFPFRRMARGAIEYLRECIEGGQRPT